MRLKLKHETGTRVLVSTCSPEIPPDKRIKPAYSKKTIAKFVQKAQRNLYLGQIRAFVFVSFLYSIS